LKYLKFGEIDIVCFNNFVFLDSTYGAMVSTYRYGLDLNQMICEDKNIVQIVSRQFYFFMAPTTFDLFLDRYDIINGFNI
jgi:hypothetical protein